MYRTVEAVGGGGGGLAALSSRKVCLLLLKIGSPIKIGKKLLKRFIVKINLIPPSIQIICMHKCKHIFWLYCRFIATTPLPALLPL